MNIPDQPIAMDARGTGGTENHLRVSDRG